MTLSIRGDISPNGITFQGACASGNNFLAVTTEARFRKYVLSSTSFVFSACASLAGTSPSGIAFIANSSAIVAYQGSSRFSIYDINTLAVSEITTNATPTQRTTNEQIAAYPATNMALATSSTNGRLTLVSLTCAAALNPSYLSGVTARCVITKPDSGGWLIGTGNGKIHELSSTGVLVTTVHVPSAPFVSSPTIAVQALSYYNGTLLAATDGGQLLQYSWPSGTLNHRIPLYASNSSNPTVVLCQSVGGTTLASNGGSIGTNFKGVEEIFFGSKAISIDNVFYNETTSGVGDVGIEPNQQYAWALHNTNSNLIIRIFNISNLTQTQCGTRVMDPIGSDIAARIIRIRDDNGVGNATVELDQQIFPGFAGLLATDSRNYIEIALKGNVVNGNPPYTAWDVREFQA